MKVNGRNFERSSRVDSLLRHILAEEITEMADSDDRLVMLTVTGVSCSKDLKHATVWFDHLSEDSLVALLEIRHKLQRRIAKQVKMKRTPILEFGADPAISAGEKVDLLLKRLTFDS